MKQVVILKTGSKIAELANISGDYEDWIRAGMGLLPADVMVIDVVAGDALPVLSDVNAVVITGSAAMVTDATQWIERSAEWLRKVVAANIPLLGICFGHQLLAYALGGRVDYNPRGVEVGTMEIELTADASHDPLFGAMPTSFPAQLSHRQSVVELPAGARLLASSEMEPHQAFAWGNCAWGIQFHPEFDERIIPFFIEHYRGLLEEEGRTVDVLQQKVGLTPESHSLLERFTALVGRTSG